MDVLYEKTSLTYKLVGGILDFYVLAGPTPADVVRQYTDVIGKPRMIPYWSLGYHQSRWGYSSVDALEEVVKRHKEVGVPLEVMWSDIEYFFLVTLVIWTDTVISRLILLDSQYRV